ncbi:hypothetical protein FQN52_005707 [Onygenales sp. PD_12]|nr:hypothetical protein FQN52_005707 [Onygenales sp. PD_12]KAK2803018.1 hypothetical protein FQN51_004045 [Onygenales sp. PD_10]
MNSLSLCMRRGAAKSPRCPRISPILKRATISVSQSRNIIARPLSSSSVAPLAPRFFPTSGFKVIDCSQPIEEERLPDYQADIYYPAHIGQVFNNRYQIVGKLGYGVTSTVWLARDLVKPDDPGYVSLKIYVSGYTRGNEIAMYERINAIAAKSKHSGYEDIRKFITSFEVQGPHAKHICIVQQALGITMDRLLPYLKNNSLTLEAVKPFLRQLLFALDFLHTQAGIIHTDLQPKNLLLPVSNPSFYKEFGDGEGNDPSDRKIYKDRTIYASRYMSQSLKGLPLICDFGDARVADQEHDDLIMPGPYRAPEVVMQTKWNCAVDIWSFGMVAWHFVASKPLFSGRDPETNEHHDGHLIAELGAVLGPPPSELMHRSRLSIGLGKWKKLVPMPDITLEKLAAGNIQGAEDKDKERFLRFLRRILCWLPEERPSAKDLIFDPWLMDGLGFTDEQVEYYKEHWLEEDGEEQDDGS